MPGSIFRPLTQSLTTLSSIARDLVHLLVLVSRSRRALAAENLFLRKQLALFQERKVKPHRADDYTRLIMVILGRLFAWRDAPSSSMQQNPSANGAPGLRFTGVSRSRGQRPSTHDARPCTAIQAAKGTASPRP